MARFTSKGAVATGASKGSGAGIARWLAPEGASVAVNYGSSADDAKRVVDDIVRAGGKAVVIGGSVTIEADVARLFDQVRQAFGRLDVMVNNAGVYAPAPIEGLSVAEFNRHFDTNVLGLLLTTRASLSLFPATGGSIVNISPVVSTLAPPAAAIYVGTKGAVDSINNSLAKEFAPRKIRVNAVNPGFVITEGTHAAGLAGGVFEAWAVVNSPLGRAANPRTSQPRSRSWPLTTRAGSPAGTRVAGDLGMEPLPLTAHERSSWPAEAGKASGAPGGFISHHRTSRCVSLPRSLRIRVIAT